MSMIVAAVMFIPLLAVSIAHLVWSFGGSWPIRDKAMLPKVAFGIPGRTVPRFASFVVSVVVLGVGITGLALADRTGGGVWLTLLGVVFGAVFIARGVLGYTKGWRAIFSDEPFATLDRRNYSPLCLILGAGFLLLVLMRLI
jgi:hypothetical protein